MARKGSQSYFSSGLGFSGEDRFAREAGSSSASGVRLSPFTADDPASNGGVGSQGKEAEPARAPFASRPTQAGVRRGGLNSRFAVRSSGKNVTPSQQLRGCSENGTAAHVPNDDSQSRKPDVGENRRVADEGRRHGVSEGVKFGVSGNRGSLSGRADTLGDDLQTKRAAAAAAAYTASLTGNPRVVRVDTGKQGSNTSSGRPAVSKSTLFQRGVAGESLSSTVRISKDQEVPEVGRFVFGAGLGAAADVSRRVPSISKISEGLDSIRNTYGGMERADERPPGRETAPGKRTGASGISSFLDLNSPPSGEATFFDAFADAAAGSLGGAQATFAKQQKRTSNGSLDRSAHFGVEGPAEFSRFLEHAFGLLPLASEQGGVSGPQHGPEETAHAPQTSINAPQAGVNATHGSVNAPQGREPRHRPFATMYRQKQAEDLAQGLDNLNLSKQAGVQSRTETPSFNSQPSSGASLDNSSLFQTAPEAFFKAPSGRAPAHFAFGFPAEERSATGKSQEKPNWEGNVGAQFGLFGVQPGMQPQPQPQPQPQSQPPPEAPSLFQTPPDVLFGHRPTPGSFGPDLRSPAFSQSPKVVNAEKPKSGPPQGIQPFVFSAGSSEGSVKSGGRTGTEAGDTWQLNQTFTERLHLADALAQERKPTSTASSLKGSRGFCFQGSIPDEEPLDAAFNTGSSGPFGKNEAAGAVRSSADRGMSGEYPPVSTATSTEAPKGVNSPPVFGGIFSGVSATQQNPGFVAFCSTEGSPGTPAKRKSDQKLAKKASPGGRNGFTSTRTLQRTPPVKPPVAPSPSAPVTQSENGTQEAGGRVNAAGNERAGVESPQPMDISPGRDFSTSAAAEQEGPTWEKREKKSSVHRAEPGVKPAGKTAAGDSWRSRASVGVSAGSEEPAISGRVGEGVNAPQRNVKAEHKGASSPQASMNGPQARGKRSQSRVNGRLGAVNRSQVGASYDGDLEEGNSSFEESETDKRTAEGGTAWTGKWSPPKEPYEYDTSESESESEDEVNLEGWVKVEKDKLARLKKTEGAGGGNLGDSGFDSLLEEESAAEGAKQVEALGADVDEMDLGSVEEPGGSLESDVENEAESAATFSAAAAGVPGTGVSSPFSEPVRGLKQFGEEGRSESSARELPPVDSSRETGSAQTAGTTPAAPFLFGAGKAESASTPQAEVFDSPDISSKGPMPPLAPPFVFTSGPTAPKSPKRASVLRRSTDRSDPLRRSTDSGRRRSLEKGKALNRSVDGLANAGLAGVSARAFPPGPDEGPGRPFSAGRGFAPSTDDFMGRPTEPTVSQSSTVPEWGQGLKSARLSASSQPPFPNAFAPSSANSPNPFTASSPDPTFQASPHPNPVQFPDPSSVPSTKLFPISPEILFPDSADPTHAGSATPASSKPNVPVPEQSTGGPMPAIKPTRKARRVGPNKAQQSEKPLHAASPVGRELPIPGPAHERIASPEAMDEESTAKQQGNAARQLSRSYLYYPESAMSYAQFFGTDGGGSTPGGGSESEGPVDAQAQAASIVSKSIRAAATCERWRLKGNQAYASKDYGGAEALYTKGVDAVASSDGFVHERCEKAAAVCLSNRAAVRMALRRVREALSDCRRATAADPDFAKVRLRTANCHVLLGEFTEAQAVFRECAERGANLEANEGLARTTELSALTAKIAELLECPELLDLSSESNLPASNGHLSPSEAASASEIFVRPFRQVSAIRAAEAQKLLADALVAAPHSEALLQMRALSLMWARSFEEILTFCALSLAASELNARVGGHVAGGAGAEDVGPGLDGLGVKSDGAWTHSDGVRPQSDGSGVGSDANRTAKEGVRLWRWRVSALAQYHLGKVEEADELAGKVDAMTGGGVGVAGFGATEETLGGLRMFIKDLLKHKAAGNAAFQSGRREAAIEHYSAALGCNSSSRPFNAVCLANRAAAYQALGSFAEAIADCSRAIVLDPGYAKALSRRATLHDLIRDHSESVRDLERLSGLLTARQSFGHRDPQLAQEVRSVADRKRKAQEAAQKEIPVDHYKVLGVEKDGGEAEVKKAYRKAALRHHPDKAVQFLSMLKEEEKAAVTEEIHSEAERLFKLIGEAYNVLSNPSKRMAYDGDEEDRTFRSSARPFGRSTRSQGFSRSTAGRSSWSNVRRPFDSEWAEDFFGRKGRSSGKTRGDDYSESYWDADFY